MHVCGQAARFDAFVDYPVAAFSWALGPDNPSLAEGHQRTGKAVMGGLPTDMAVHTPAEVSDRTRAAIDDMRGRWLLLAPGCSIAISTPDDLLLTARDTARRTEHTDSS
jgi:uroporphyrinogen decarboxylase